ncbi:DUF6221 family protein [Streptomyces sp. NPDC087298]|uniref:DUF6221 family protein n=1 Tax=Streptomyces sp. NPDC087298 TaxID=3365779 RepID=UPI00381D98F9
MNAVDDLAAFLRDRLDEDVAKADTWHDLECDIHAHLDDGLLSAIATSRMLEEVPGAVCDCGGPVRVRAEVEAKRELLRQYEHLKDDVMPDDLTGVWAFEAVLRAFALPYADHYREEWRP